MDRSKWEYKKLGEICDKGSSNIAQNKIEDISGEYALYGASGYVKGIDFYHQEKPYIGIVKDGSGVGRANLYPAKSSLLGTMQYIIPKDVCELGFLLYVIKGLHLEKYKTGAAIPHIYFKDYCKSIVPFPPLADQQRIVAELDCLNEMIVLKQEQLKEFDKLAQSIFYDMFGDPATNEKGWELREMESLCTHIVDCPHSTPKKVDVITPYPCIRTSELKGGEVQWDTMQYLDEQEYEIRVKRLRPLPGDIVFGREGTIGDAVILPRGYNFSLGQRTMLLRVDKSVISEIFLHRTIMSEWVRRQIKMVNVSSTVAHVNIKDFKVFDIPLPPLALQQQFAEKIQAIEAQKELVKKSIAETQQLLDSRMDYYFD